MPIVRISRAPGVIFDDIASRSQNLSNLARACSAGLIPVKTTSETLVRMFAKEAAWLAGAAGELDHLRLLTKDVPLLTPEGDALGKLALATCIHARSREMALAKRSRTRRQKKLAAGQGYDPPPVRAVATGETPAVVSGVSERGLGKLPLPPKAFTKGHPPLTPYVAGTRHRARMRLRGSI